MVHRLYTHIAGDRGSDCVKAGVLRTMTYVTGISHGLSRDVWNSYNASTNRHIRKKGKRVKTRNGFHRRRFRKAMQESRESAKFVQTRSLNGNFGPSMKVVKYLSPSANGSSNISNYDLEQPIS